MPSPAPSSLLGCKRAILCPGSQLSGRDSHALPGSAALGGLSLFASGILETPGERRRSLLPGRCGLLLGAERQRGSLLLQGQHPGDAGSSFSTWVPAARALGCLGCTGCRRAGAPLRAVFPPAAQTPRAEAAAGQGHAGALAGNATAPAPRQGSSSSPASTSPERAL